MGSDTAASNCAWSGAVHPLLLRGLRRRVQAQLQAGVVTTATAHTTVVKTQTA